MQTRDNHARFDPGYHFFLLPLWLLAFLWTLYLVYRHHSQTSVVLVLLAFALGTAIFKLRMYSLKVQDRLIRTEERIRIYQLCTPEVASRAVAALTPAQYIALRFASDAELPQLVTATLDQKLSRKDIKSRIQNWRADDFRV